jgi:hypothetical protein
LICAACSVRSACSTLACRAAPSRLPRSEGVRFRLRLFGQN